MARAVELNESPNMPIETLSTGDCPFLGRLLKQIQVCSEHSSNLQGNHMRGRTRGKTVVAEIDQLDRSGYFLIYQEQIYSTRCTPYVHMETKSLGLRVFTVESRNSIFRLQGDCIAWQFLNGDAGAGNLIDEFIPKMTHITTVPTEAS